MNCRGTPRFRALKLRAHCLRAPLCVGLSLVLAASGLFSPSGATAGGEVRTLSIHNIHTKETVTATFKRDGKFVPEALQQFNHVMRDWRKNEPTRMDPELIDLIWTIHRDLGSRQPVHLISGYRSPATNASLRRRRGGQAKNSQHMQGKASDIHFPDVPVKALRNSALIREKGGVGFYPTSGIPFVHVDTARVRSWPRVPRQELALLFPNGKSKHLPASGGALTPADSRKAMAEFKQKGRDEQIAMAKVLPNVVLASLNMPTRSPAPFVQVAEGPQGRTQLASLSGGNLPWFGNQPSAVRAAAPARFEIRPAEQGSAISKTARDALSRKIMAAAVDAAPEFDDDHSDSLSYNPIEIAPLMAETSVSFDGKVAALEHPEQNATAYLFTDLEHPVGLSMAQGRAYAQPAALNAFSGAAVRNVYAADTTGSIRRAAAGESIAVASAR